MPSAAARLLDILSEGRKAGICALAASHLDTAEGMGISGEKDMLKCFDMVLYLGAMATKCVPTAARMARPAVVYDPEHDVWAQLIIALPTAAREPTPDDEEAPPPVEPVALQRPANAPPRRAPVRPPPPVLPTAAPPDDLLAGLLAQAGAPTPLPALPQDADLSAVSPGRAARLAAILGRQGAAPTLASASTPTAAVSVPSASERHEDKKRPHVPTSPSQAWGHGDTHTGVTLETGEGGEIHVHLHARAEAHAPPVPPWRRKGPRIDARTRRHVHGSDQGRADELRRAYVEAGATGRAYRAAYRELGGNKNTTLSAWQAGRAQKQEPPRE